LSTNRFSALGIEQKYDMLQNDIVYKHLRKQNQILDNLKNKYVIKVLCDIIKQDFIGHEKLRNMFVEFVDQNKHIKNIIANSKAESQDQEGFLS